MPTGRWRRVHHAVYFTHGGFLRPTQRRWLAVLAASADGCPALLGGINALQVHGLRGITSERIVELVQERL